MTQEEYPYKQECYNIIGCAMSVHSELGYGFLEAVYQEALSIVLAENKIQYEKEKILDIEFKGQKLKKSI